MGYSKMLMFAGSVRRLVMIKKIILLLSFLSLFIHAGCTTYDVIQPVLSQQAGEKRLEALNGKYKLSPPDVIEIVVQDNPELGTRSIIRPDGNVFIPLLGDIYVEGLTPLQVRDEMHKLLGRYMKDLPLESISIQVLGYNSKKVYVHSYGTGGIVTVPFTGDLTVLDAITNSGLLTRTSNEKGIRITRGVSDPDKKPQVFAVNLNDIIKKGRSEYNMVLRPNDIVYIPPTILGRIGYALQDALFPVRPVEQLGRTAASAQYNALGFGASRLGTTGSNRGYDYNR